MLVGYARISTTDQTPALQRDALEKAGPQCHILPTSQHILRDSFLKLLP